jgi:rhodanese-related sulfurtransferase
VLPVNTPEIDIDQLAQAVRGGATIVDVREPSEYVAGWRDERVGPLRPSRRRRRRPSRLRSHPSASKLPERQA